MLQKEFREHMLLLSNLSDAKKKEFRKKEVAGFCTGRYI